MSDILEAPAPPPAPTSEIHVTPETVDRGPQPEAPKPGSARARLFDDLRAKAKPAEPTVPEKVTAKPPAKPAAKAPEKPAAKPAAKPQAEKPAAEQAQEAEKPGEGEAETKPEAEAAAEPEKPMTAEEKKRVNPWKLVDQYKGQNAKLQEEVTKLRTGAVPEAERKVITERIEKAEKRAKELEDHIRFLDYQKHPEFTEKYQKPYEEAWVRAMSELGELTVNENGVDRPLTANDLLELVTLPLPRAREVAKAVFGDFANDVMAHRNSIKQLFDAQSKALDDARKNGAERMRQMQEQVQKQVKEISDTINEAWETSNAAMVRDEKYGLYFTPVEGDENVNQRLAKGYALVDRAFSENPQDPKLTPDQRRSVIKRHAAVRNRAAAFGRLVYELGNERQRVQELTEELKKYKESTPPTGGSPQAEASGGAPTSARESVFAALRAKAR